MKGRGPLGRHSNYAGPPAPEDVRGSDQNGDGRFAGEGRMARGGRLAREAFAVVRSDRGLLGLMLCAVVLDLAIVGTFAGGAAALAGHRHRRLVLLVAIFGATYPTTVVGTFFNVALLNTVARGWAGEKATVIEGLRLARSRIRTILAWSVLTASIGGVLSLAEKINHLAWVERIVAYLFDMAWGVASFFVIPALAADDIGPREALKRSVQTVRARWAESATGTVAIGGATGLLLIPGVLVGLGGYHAFAQSPGTGAFLIGVGAVLGLPVLVYGSTTSAVFTLAVYRYAQDSSAHGPFAEMDLANPFVGGGSLRSVRSWFAGLAAKLKRGSDETPNR